MAVIKKRNSALDWLRIFCCYCIIMLHVSGHLNLNGNLWRLVQGIVRPALWCFLVLSGYFILSRQIKDWKKFYFTHLIHLIVPLVLYVFIYQIYYSRTVSLSAIIAGDPVGHLWFVYSLIVLYIMAPFLQKMLTNLSNIQLTSLLVLMFFFGRVINIIPSYGVAIGLPATILGDCTLFFFILGYWLSRVKLKLNYKFIIPIGIVNILYTAYTFSNPILVNGAANLALGMVVGCIIYYTLFVRTFAMEKDNILSKVTAFISKRTYGIYLIHMLIFQYFTANGIMALDPDSYSNIWILPLKCLVIFGIGLIIAIIMDLIICEPIQKLCNYIYEQISLQFERQKSISADN